MERSFCGKVLHCFPLHFTSIVPCGDLFPYFELFSLDQFLGVEWVGPKSVHFHNVCYYCQVDFKCSLQLCNHTAQAKERPFHRHSEHGRQGLK